MGIWAANLEPSVAKYLLNSFAIALVSVISIVIDNPIGLEEFFWLKSDKLPYTFRNIFNITLINLKVIAVVKLFAKS